MPGRMQQLCAQMVRVSVYRPSPKRYSPKTTALISMCQCTAAGSVGSMQAVFPWKASDVALTITPYIQETHGKPCMACTTVPLARPNISGQNMQMRTADSSTCKPHKAHTSGPSSRQSPAHNHAYHAQRLQKQPSPTSFMQVPFWTVPHGWGRAATGQPKMTLAAEPQRVAGGPGHQQAQVRPCHSLLVQKPLAVEARSSYSRSCSWLCAASRLLRRQALKNGLIIGLAVQ